MKPINFSFVATVLRATTLVVALFLVACGGSEEPAVEEVGTAVALTIAAINATGTPLSELPPTPTIATPPSTAGSPTASVPPTLTLPPATSTPLPPMATLQPPTATLSPPTATLSPPTATLSPPTATLSPTATQIVRLPPDLDNVATGGTNFPAERVFGEVIVEPTFLIRMAVRDSNFFASEGDRDGAGIDHVEFSVNDSEGFRVYEHRENVAGYCIFAGGEPTCNPWPVNEFGEYTWGEAGPIVVSGEYVINITVFSKAPESDPDFGGVWIWIITMTVTVPSE
jgi:hypothetical protein